MLTKPGDWFIGLIDFFSIVLPGAIVTSLCYHFLPSLLSLFNLPSDSFDRLVHGTISASAAFFIASYVLGHFTAAVSYEMFEWFPGQLRSLTTRMDLASGNYLKGFRDTTVPWLEDKITCYMPEADRKELRPYEWAKARLTVNNSLALTEVDRLEAESKFFRSLATVCCLAWALFGRSKDNPFVHCWYALVVAFSYVRFCALKSKAARWVYLYCLELNNKTGSLNRELEASECDFG